ncbi:MAG: CDP-alcohol phosphatidyltransferase family protein [Deltaproteobacteria bacterium]|nr:CDP-alcohol phosphatidyltransferase family protein [Deltaproteobacteria bacterium]
MDAIPTTKLLDRTTTILVYGRPVLVFGGVVCALTVMWTRDPWVYTLGVSFLLVSMIFDLIDGWFAARFRPGAHLAPLADRIMDKMVYSIIFPVIAVGVMWRMIGSHPSRIQLFHAIFVLILCVTVLIRDHFAAFMRGFALRQGSEPESVEFTRLRTVVAAPVSALLYAYAFHISEGPSIWIYQGVTRLATLRFSTLFFIEIVFLIINFGSIAAYCRKYGTLCLDELCFGDQGLRRKILSVLPNALTVMNAVMGMIGVFFAAQGRFREMYFMIIGAAAFDKLDGAIARRLGLTEPLPDEANPPQVSLGNLMDDLADAVSFCIAPAWIFYIAMSRFGHHEWGPVSIAWIALLYVVAGIARLVYFTIDKHPIAGFFKGLPSPAAALLVLSPIVVYSQSASAFPQWTGFGGDFIAALMIFSALVMNLYPVHYIHMGRAMSRNRWLNRLLIMGLLFFAFTPYLGHVALAGMVLYVFSPLFTWRISPAEAARETRK